MVTLISYGANGTTYAGLADDDKPTEGVPNGACYISMDNGKIFFFNAAESGGWIEWGA